MKILIGSNNSSKQSEISSIFNESALEPITPQNLSINYDPPEVSGTHKEIAEQKALQWSKITEYLVISTLVTLTIFFGLVPSSLINISRWIVRSYL